MADREAEIKLALCRDSILRADMVYLLDEVKRLKASIRELFDAMTAGGGNRNHTQENNERLVAAWKDLRGLNAAAKEQADG